MNGLNHLENLSKEKKIEPIRTEQKAIKISLVIL